METVYQLDPVNAPAARALFERAGVRFDRPYREAAFDGLMPARLFVDHPTEPVSAVLTRTYDFFLAGDPAPAIAAFLQDAPDGSNLYEWFYGFVPLSQSWREELPRLLPELFTVDRLAFRLSAAGYAAAHDWAQRLPAGIRIVPLDAALARQTDEQVPDVIALLWDGYERFARDGWGYAALDDSGQVVSNAFAAGLTAREVNLAVGTAERAQRRGLGRLVCQACIAHAAGAGLEVTWDCDRANEASRRLALSLGFELEEEFLELGLPERVIPERTGHPWQHRALPDGVTEWRRG